MSETMNAVDEECVYAIADRVAAREGVEPTDLPPLFDSVDADALSTLLGGDTDSLTVEFTYCGYRVTVDGGAVSLAELD